jgi:hypothetical protein
MKSKVDDLISSYEKIVKEPWLKNLSGQEKVWFLVYEPVDQRKISLRIGDFERATKRNDKKWLEIDLQSCFPNWMSNHEYKVAYFKDPQFIQDQLEYEFKNYVADFISAKIDQTNDPENTVAALVNVSSLFGFLKLSDVLDSIYSQIKGRLLVFFPGDFNNNQFRLMDARDGWSYLARPI